MPDAFETPSVDRDEDDLASLRVELAAELGDHFDVATRYLFSAGPLFPVGAIAVGNSHDWAAYVAGLPIYGAPGPFWSRVYRDGAKLPQDVAIAWFPGFSSKPYRV